MNKMTRPERVESFANTLWPMSEVGTAAFHQFWDRGRTIAVMVMDWNAEFADFMSHRINHTSGSIGQVAQCRSLPELLEAEGQWFKRAYDDYSEQAGKLMEANGKLLGSLAGSTEQLQQHPAGAKPSPTVAS